MSLSNMLIAQILGAPCARNVASQCVLRCVLWYGRSKEVHPVDGTLGDEREYPDSSTQCGSAVEIHDGNPVSLRPRVRTAV